MNKDDLKRLAENDDFIPGIYNYCDRWCERCPFTSRCMSYAMEAEIQAEHGPLQTQPDNDAFWQQISESLQATFDLIREMAEEQNIDLDSFNDMEAKAAMERRESNRESARTDDLTVEAMQYVKMVMAWFDAAGESFDAKGGELEQAEQLEIAGRDVSGEVAELNDAVEVIRWYQFQIQVKLMRALSGSMNEKDTDVEWSEDELELWLPEPGENESDVAESNDEEMPEEEEDFQKDSDGSAKVALIGIDRSIVAWSRLLAAFPEQEDDLLAILVHLERLRRAVERRFPDARSFVRPGFDEVR